MFPVEIILHPTDFSESALAAYRLACSLARDTGARLIILHVEPTPTVMYGQGVLPADAEGEHARVKERLHKEYPGDPKIEQEIRIVQGEATREILHEAEELKAGLIVMGTHGRTGLSRLLMGSVAEHVLRHARCPVLIVRR